MPKLQPSKNAVAQRKNFKGAYLSAGPEKIIKPNFPGAGFWNLRNVDVGALRLKLAP